MSKSFILEFLRYSAASDKRHLKALQQHPETPAKAWKVFSHIINAYEVWLSRMQNRPQRFALFEKHPKQNMKERLEEIHGDVKTYVQSLSEEDLLQTFDYIATEGTKHRSVKKDIFIHMVNHATHHRGQISQMLRQAGFQPAATDYVLFTRENLD